MSSSDPVTPAQTVGAADERATRGHGAAAVEQAANLAAQKAMVRARMFGTATAKIGRYAILDVLGAGGMGTVYACFDDQLDRRVALKLVKGAATQEARGRMLREAQALAKLSHPNVVPVFEVGEHLGRVYIAMEYVRGSTLQRWQADEARDWADVFDAYLQAGFFGLGTSCRLKVRREHVLERLLRAKAKGVANDPSVLDPVDAEHSGRHPEVIPRDDVPNWPVQKDVVGFDDSLCDLAALGLVLDLQRVLAQERLRNLFGDARRRGCVE